MNCPACGTPGAYQGLGKPECVRVGCEFFKIANVGTHDRVAVDESGEEIGWYFKEIPKRDRLRHIRALVHPRLSSDELVDRMIARGELRPFERELAIECMNGD